MLLIRKNWQIFFSSPARRLEFFIALAFLISLLLTTLNFLQFVESRPGVQLNDPVLNLLPPIDLSEIIFYLLYLGLFFAITFLLPSPQRILLGIEAYALYVIFRTIAMSLVPLEAPAGLIPLVDPILKFASTGKQLNKDLFFSGHTSTMYLLFLMMPAGRYKKIFLLAVIVMAACLIIQRVHYTIDVMVAPFFAYCSLRIVLWFRSKLNLESFAEVV